MDLRETKAVRRMVVQAVEVAMKIHWPIHVAEAWLKLAQALNTYGLDDPQRLAEFDADPRDATE